jgi:RNA polymerase sigma factor (sigma-70 family)
MDLSADRFESFLGWLHPDREEAGRKYEQIRRRLIALFRARGCPAAEELADEAFNRVIRRSAELSRSFEGEPIRYIYTVAHHLHLEYLESQARKRRVDLPDALPDPAHEAAEEAAEEERSYRCLEHCMEALTPNNRELVLKYYLENRQAKIDLRKKLAEWMGVPLNALRIRMCRIRDGLRECVRECRDNPDVMKSIRL